MSFRIPRNPNFFRFFRGWNRLEGRSRRDELDFAIAAPVADAAFLIGRQWQLAELTAENAGSSIHVKVTTEHATLDELVLGASTKERLDGIPAEVLVERETVDWDWRLRVRAG